ncbi:MAG TPA: rRNA adenine dimethyltransferase family protein [Phycisphaerae bacterium]
MHVQTQTEIRALLGSAGVRPRKRWGQHFLVDGNLMRRLFESAEVTVSDAVLEVGAGTGGLTDLLVEAGRHVVAVEIDPVLFGLLQVRYAGRPNITLIQADALHSKHQIAATVGAALVRHRPDAAGAYKLVANLPYNVATPLVMNLLTWNLPLEGSTSAGRDSREGGCEKGFSHQRSLQVERMCFTVQQEVAERMAAAPGSGEYGPISVALQATCTIRRVATVPPSAFWPRPQVASAMLRIDRTGNPFGDLARLARFIEFVRACFGHRRKTLRYALTRTLGDSTCAALGALVDLQRRPETIAVGEWLELWRAAGECEWQRDV